MYEGGIFTASMSTAEPLSPHNGLGLGDSPGPPSFGEVNVNDVTGYRGSKTVTATQTSGSKPGSKHTSAASRNRDVDSRSDRKDNDITEMPQGAHKGKRKNSEAKSGQSKEGEEKGEHVVDIVKQSNLKDTTQTVSDFADMPDFPPSRPFTDISFREGTKLGPSDVEKREYRHWETHTEGRDFRSPLTVSVERKPIHTGTTRSHSDYFTKASTATGSRFTYIAASLSQMDGIGIDMRRDPKSFTRHTAPAGKGRRPPKLIRLATVTMSPKTKPVPRGPSLYYEEPKKPSKVITWEEANNARPPLRVDMEGPGPWSYSPRNKPLNETNAPSWSFRGKCVSEKDGGSRTSWEKTWFQTPNVWTNKTDFYSDSAWPTPVHYKQRPMLGPRQKTTPEAPSFTIGVRKELTMTKPGVEKEPSPVDYDRDIADKIVLKKGPSFSHQFRREGTIIWGSKDKTPGPGAYSPTTSFSKPHGPAFTIRNLRREKSHVLGPFSTF